MLAPPWLASTAYLRRKAEIIHFQNIAHTIRKSHLSRPFLLRNGDLNSGFPLRRSAYQSSVNMAGLRIRCN